MTEKIIFQLRAMMTCLRAGTSSDGSECGDTATELASIRSGWPQASLCTGQHILVQFTCQVRNIPKCFISWKWQHFLISGYTAYAAHNPLSSYSSLPQLSPPSYHQYSPSLGYVDNTAPSPLSSFSSPSASIRGHNPSSTEERSYASQFNIFWSSSSSTFSTIASIVPSV